MSLNMEVLNNIDISNVDLSDLVLDTIDNERALYKALKLIHKYDLARDNSKAFIASLVEGINKYGTLNTNQLPHAKNTIRSHGQQLLMLIKIKMAGANAFTKSESGNSDNDNPPY